MRPSNRAPLPAKLEFCAIRRRAAGGSPGPGCGDRHGFLHRRRDHRRSRWRACGARRWPASPSPLMPQVPFVSPARSPACKPPRGVARWLALPGLQRADHPRRSAAARLVGTRGTQFGGRRWFTMRLTNAGHQHGRHSSGKTVTDTIQRTGSLAGWVALAFAFLAYCSLREFPGLPGWLGAIGWVVVAGLVYRHPSLLEPRARAHKHAPRVTALLALALALIVASVVVWSVEH